MEEFNAGLIVGCVLWIIVLLFAWAGVNESWRQEATDKGFAEYYLDSNHSRQWRWKEAK